MNYSILLHTTSYEYSTGNGSGMSWSDDGRRRSANWILLPLAIVPLWIVSGNCLVLISVIRRRILRTLSNRVIASLAFTDLLLALFVVPLGIYQMVVGDWNLGFYSCLVWTGCDVILSTASIMHLCAIALNRYHGIAHPLRVRSERQRRHVAALVVPAWSVSVALSIPFVVQAVMDRSHVLIASPGTSTSCGLFNQSFAVYSSLVSFFIPLAVMVVADFRSIQILRRSVTFPQFSFTSASTKCRKSPLTTTTSIAGGPECPMTSQCHSDNNTLKVPRCDELIDASSKPISMTSQIAHLPVIEASLSTTSSDVSNLRQIGSHPNDGDDLSASAVSGTPTEVDISSPPLSPRDGDDQPSSGCRGILCGNDGRWRIRSKSMAYIDMLASHGAAAKTNGRERRAERTLVWVFAVFVALWLPFFCTNLTYGLCGERCQIPDVLFTVFSWLGYLSSGVNPCIYTLLNRDFRNAFRDLITCRKAGTAERRSKSTRVTSLLNNRH